MLFEIWISLRYIFKTHKEIFMSLTSLISILGVAIGVMALIVVIAVMSGFDNDLKDKIVGSNPHLIIQGYQPIVNYEDVRGEIKRIPGVLDASVYIQSEAFLYNNNRIFGSLVRGVDPRDELKVTGISKYLNNGKFLPDENCAVLGSELLYLLGLNVGDSITMITPLGGKKIPFLISGSFASGMYEYDAHFVFIQLKKAQEIFGFENSVSSIGIKLNNPYRADQLKSRIHERIGFSFLIKSWMDINKNFFSALKLEKATMFIILTLIVLVASFNIIGTLVVMVANKTKDIGILKSIGLSNKRVGRVFTLCGLFIGFIGISLGVLSGIILCILLKKYQFVQLPADIYYIDKLPVALQWQDVGLIAGAAFFISLFSTVYPAKRAARMNPVEALRYE